VSGVGLVLNGIEPIQKVLSFSKRRRVDACGAFRAGPSAMCGLGGLQRHPGAFWRFRYKVNESFRLGGGMGEVVCGRLKGGQWVWKEGGGRAVFGWR
jgi:hypothetical protein